MAGRPTSAIPGASAAFVWCPGVRLQEWLLPKNNALYLNEGYAVYSKRSTTPKSGEWLYFPDLLSPRTFASLYSLALYSEWAIMGTTDFINPVSMGF